MLVTKRDGSQQPVDLNKITNRISSLCYGLDMDYIDPVSVAIKVVNGLYPGVSTRELDRLAAETCAFSSTYHPDWSILAARIAVSDLHKQTSSSFSQNAKRLYEHVHPKTGLHAPLIAENVYQAIMANAERLDAAIDYNRDFEYDYFGFKTLERSYLLRYHNEIAERPQQLFMRVSMGIHCNDIDAAIQTYDLMSRRYFTHATPTLFNAGTPRPQLSSCFLLTMKDDSIDGIYDTLKQCARISKYAGGIGLSIHNIRSKNSYIRGTNGTSNGIVPMLRVFNDTARYVDQAGKRKGSFAIYLEPWHPDIFDFCELRKNTGKEEQRCRDLFLALWIPDLFMKRVEQDGVWSLMDPDECPGLADTCGPEFEALYHKYESEGKFSKQVKAQNLWFHMLDCQIETGVPFMLFKDACNLKSNQQNLGVIKSSNLCTEIVEYTAPDEVAVCNLASIALNMFVTPANEATSAPASFDFDRLVAIAKVITRNLNKVIDINFYPVEEARKSNLRHRPIGIGVQGLADCFALMKYPFESPEARQLNRDIFEAIYYGAVEASAEIAEVDGPYETFQGSPASKGKLQFDLWNVTPSDRFDWASLKAKVMKTGIRNSLLLAPMPTASTAQILGNNESIEPFTSNIYTRRVLAGEFPVVNKYLLRALIDRNLWTKEVRTRIIADKGSIQSIPAIPQDIKDIFKTVWEIKQRTIIDLAADRGAFVCQSQSLNIHLADPTIAKLTSMHFHAWKMGLKTGMYYLRTRPKVDAIQFTVDQTALAEMKKNDKTDADSEGNSFKVNNSSPKVLDGSPVDSGKKASFPPSSSSSSSSSFSLIAGGSPVAPSTLSKIKLDGIESAVRKLDLEDDSTPAILEKDAIMAARRKAAEEERKRILANLDSYDFGEEVCISCGS